MIIELTRLKQNATVYHANEGYFYYKRKEEYNRVYLRCASSRTCPGKASMPRVRELRTADSLRLTHQHDHPPQHSWLEVLTLRNRILQRCSTEGTRFREIHRQETERVGQNVAANLPFQSLTSAMFRARHTAEYCAFRSRCDEEFDNNSKTVKKRKNELRDTRETLENENTTVVKTEKSQHVVCCAIACTNTSDSCVMTNLPHNPLLRQQWLNLIDRDDLTPNNESALCEVHFGPEMWDQDCDGRKLLVPNAVPTLCLHGEGNKSWVTVENTETVDIKDINADRQLSEDRNLIEIDESCVLLKQENLHHDKHKLNIDNEECHGEQSADVVREPFETIYFDSNDEQVDSKNSIANVPKIELSVINQNETEAILPEEIVFVQIKQEPEETMAEEQEEDTNDIQEPDSTEKLTQNFEKALNADNTNNELPTTDTSTMPINSTATLTTSTQTVLSIDKPFTDSKTNTSTSCTTPPSQPGPLLIEASINSQESNSSGPKQLLLLISCAQEMGVMPITPKQVASTQMLVQSQLTGSSQLMSSSLPIASQQSIQSQVKRSSELKMSNRLPIESLKSIPTQGSPEVLLSQELPLPQLSVPPLVHITAPPTQPPVPPQPSSSELMVDDSEMFSISLAQCPRETRVAIKRKIIELVEAVKKRHIDPNKLMFCVQKQL